ncbi:hypothetical protein PPTG_01112 [Phytophthora nicotianae INRA-310]|uniref:Uncharacterized protein n=1 Tax=Phytophthora nicotianae (strain INRA-310) TaxID=761204 RepID=W2RHT5_PHYN3|nr:hypothetical protein PPTG_01112 [Phytophthora nicotianae INRA-310]ETN24952.1 hypothetical protein PPTG_01112 [Phytophthora nicotianae INRA-310]
MKAAVRGVDYFVRGEELLKYLDRLALEELKQKQKKATVHTLLPASSSTGGGAGGGETSSMPANDQADNLIRAEQHSGVVLRISGGATTEKLLTPNGGTTDTQNNDSETVQLQQQDTDINVTRAHDSLDDYMAFNSDGETDDGFDNNDDKLNFEALDSYDDDDIAPHDVMFGDELLAAVGGIEGILADVLDPYPYMDEPYEPRPANSMYNDYPGLYDGDYGPNAEEDIALASEEYFHEKLDERVDVQYEW